MKLFKGVISSVMISLLLTSCGTDLNLPSLDSENVSIQSTLINSNLAKIDSAIDFATGTKNTLNNSNVKFHIDGPEGFPAIQELIMSAKKSLYIEVFIFSNDFTGRKFADALIDKVKQGVEVKFLYDHVGNVDVSLMNYMAKNGVHVETYNKQTFTSKGTNITHRKIYLADGVRAITGGMNVGKKYETGEWHDTVIEFEGEAVKELLTEFMFDWKRAGGKVTPMMKEAFNEPLPVNDSKKYPIRVTVTSPFEANKKEDIKKMIISAIDSAKENVKIAMPYFSDDELVDHLKLAAKRGVKVTAVIPKKSDSSLSDTIANITSNQLIKGGVEVYRGGAKNNTFNHSKVMTVDNVWTTIGSCNADNRAFHINQELNVAISDPEFTQEFNSKFFDFHISNAELGVYKNVPWYKKPVYALIEGLDFLY